MKSLMQNIKPRHTFEGIDQASNAAQLRFAVELMRHLFVAQVSEDAHEYTYLIELMCDFINNYDERHYSAVSEPYEFPPPFLQVND